MVRGVADTGDAVPLARMWMFKSSFASKEPRPLTSSPVTACAVEPKVLRAAQLSQLFTHIPDPRKAGGK